MFRIILSLLFVFTMNACGGGGGGGAVPDTTPPTVETFYPDQADGNIYSSEIVANGIYVIFDEAVKDTTIISANFMVVNDNNGGVLEPGAVTYDPAIRTAKFQPTNPFTTFHYYTVTITTGVEDLAGNALAVDFIWTFQVAGGSPPPPPL